MNRKFATIIGSILILAALPILCFASTGSGDIGVSYLFLDETGNNSVDHSSFNIYEGATLSVEDMRYLFNNGLRIRADMTNIFMNNRNLVFGLDKSGLFGITFSHNQYRRIYNFDGDLYTRRHQNSMRLWVTPAKFLKIWAGGKLYERSGQVTDMFGAGAGYVSSDLDYKQNELQGGFLLNHEGALLNGQIRRQNFTDNLDENRDRKTTEMKISGTLPVPNHEWLVLNGGFRRISSKYEISETEISANRAWAGMRADLPYDLQLRYKFIIDRASSDNDFVATDNLTNTIYLSKVWPRYALLTFGYQNGINDDYEDEISSNSFMIGGFIRPHKLIELRGEMGLTEEEIEDGSRYVGEESRNRHRFTLKFMPERYGDFQIKYTNRERENKDLGTEVDYSSITTDYSISHYKYGSISVGYTYSSGDYTNRDESFEFKDHSVYGDLRITEYKNLIGGCGITYYRSKTDLDVESIILRFDAEYGFYEDYAFKVEYNIHNFDDFRYFDRYYTANIVKISLIKHMSF